ncbi:MAG TPA: type II secretion system protein [Candidatus Avacidaminococcus intestinavium]|uniref:Type II secretion system protein n=1 Tax=Candidatus Avacidaminococcus intestinavium TaxID=2840684 RepID=A0A9D1SL72_9FIRM|nr:type II secretion system protein [Candidatus Avacidaminococcus intestinavium]
MEMLLKQMDQQFRNKWQKGITLVEVICVLMVFSVLLVILVPTWSVLQQLSEKEKINNAAQLLAADLALLQQKAMLNSVRGVSYYLVITPSGDGYKIMRNQEKEKEQKFSSNCLASIRLESILNNRIAFSNLGTPTHFIAVKVRGKSFNNNKIVEVQPVSGRIVVRNG